MEAQITNWGQALTASLTGALALFFGAIPRLLGFVVIIIVGWLIASLIEKAIVALLRAVNFNRLAERSGFADFVQKSGTRADASGLIGGIGKWFVRLIVLVVAFDALGLPAVSDVLRQLLLWLPNLVVALVVLVIGGIAASALSRIVRGAASEGGLGNPDFLARVASVAVWAFAAVVAVNQIGVATTLVNTLFAATIGAVALALGLAFGLGGRDTAGEIVRNWYLKNKEKTTRIEGSTARLSQRGDGRSPDTSRL
jgi:hypothetical protein